jgi:hypothetical protein
VFIIKGKNMKNGQPVQDEPTKETSVQNSQVPAAGFKYEELELSL